MKPNPRYAKGGGRSGRVVKTADYISACSGFALGHAWPVESEGGSVESDRKAARLAFAQSTKSTENVAKQDAHLIDTAVSLTDMHSNFATCHHRREESMYYKSTRPPPMGGVSYSFAVAVPLSVAQARG